MKPPDLCGFKPVATDRRDKRWLAVKDAGIDLKVSAPGRFTKVQQLVNGRVRYVREDVDRWAEPRETLSRGKGDCEDFALLKRAILLASGIPDEDLFFVLCWDAVRREQHALLIARQDKAYVLDVPGGLRPMYPVEEAKDFRPWAAFTGSSAWGYV